jgi:hypothetical protein
LGVGDVVLRLRSSGDGARVVRADGGAGQQPGAGADCGPRTGIPGRRTQQGTAGGAHGGSYDGAAGRDAVGRSLRRSGRRRPDLGIVAAGEVVCLELAERLARAWHRDHGRTGGRRGDAGGQRDSGKQGYRAKCGKETGHSIPGGIGCVGVARATGATIYQGKLSRTLQHLTRAWVRNY